MTRPFVHTSHATRVVFGAGSLERVASEIWALGLRRAVIVHSGSTARAATFLGDALGEGFAGLFSDVAAHVPAANAARLRADVRAAGADVVVAVGGGSAIGLGKAAALTEAVTLVAVPTTYSGSEMTPIYGITEGGHKTTGRNPRVAPAVVIYDPELTLGLPRRQTAGTGANAMAHCIEALYAPDLSPIASLLAHEGLRALAAGVAAATADPDDLDARTTALYGAFVGGTVLASAGMGLHHKICHVLGGSLGLAHGDANAVILPNVVAFNATAAADQLEPAARMFETPDLAGALFDFIERAGAPTSLSALGVDASALVRVAGIVLEDPPANPRSFGRADLIAILEAAHSGVRPGPPAAG